VNCPACSKPANAAFADARGVVGCRNCGHRFRVAPDPLAELAPDAPAAGLLAAMRARGIHSATIAPGGPGARGAAVQLAGELVTVTHVAGDDAQALRGALADFDAHAELAARRREKERA
jgi:hypothetical protein